MRNLGKCFAQSFLLATVCVLPAVQPLAAQAPVADSPAIEVRAQQMLAKLTLEQKIELMGGVDSMFTHAEDNIGLPRLKMSDASVGVRTWGPTQGYAGGVALAASWDRNYARELGAAIGGDARARGVHFLLGPGVNIARTPLNGRNFEYLSEDPYLNAQIVVPYIDGVQSRGVVATVKHFAANNQEYNRHNVDVTLDERTLREIYLPAFEAAVKVGHVDAVMNSYNLLNGHHATESPYLNLEVLKGDWQFQGLLMSDWDATYDGVAAANNGLDLEMPGPRFMNQKVLGAAVKAGTVKEATINDHVLRLLRLALRYGFLDRPQLDLTQSTYSVADRKVALDGALKSITLLKNDGILPLDASRIKTIAVIGPNAWPAVIGGGGSSQATAFEPVSILTGIANQLGPNVTVLYSRGLPEMNDVFGNTRWAGMVKKSTFDGRGFAGKPSDEMQPVVSEWKQDMWGPEDLHPRSIRYTAEFKADKAGRYLVLAAASGQDSYTINVDGKKVVEQAKAEGQIAQSATLELTAGQTIHIEADYLPFEAGIRFGFGIASEEELIPAETRQMAAKADVVVAAVGFAPETEGEGYDRTFQLPWGQDALIDAVTKANAKTVVTLIAGGAADISRWIDKVPALVDAFYPGQEGGTAIAQILLGLHAPEGRLPISFDQTLAENPSMKNYYPIAGADTKLHVEEVGQKPVEYTIPHVRYDDKLMVGYRYWTTTGKHARYPFGYGLSYTSFAFSNLKTPATVKAGATVDVSFDVTNTGKTAAAEVAQLYVSDPSATVARPERELKGFEKLALAPGETKHVTLQLDARAFSYWSETKHDWTIDPGKFVVRVGSSSEETPLTAEIELTK